MPEHGRSARQRTCNCCDQLYLVSAEQLDAPLGQVIFYEGLCLECATRAVIRVAHDQVEMRHDPAIFQTLRADAVAARMQRRFSAGAA